MKQRVTIALLFALLAGLIAVPGPVLELYTRRLAGSTVTYPVPSAVRAESNTGTLVHRLQAASRADLLISEPEDDPALSSLTELLTLLQQNGSLPPLPVPEPDYIRCTRICYLCSGGDEAVFTLLETGSSLYDLRVWLDPETGALCRLSLRCTGSRLAVYDLSLSSVGFLDALKAMAGAQDLSALEPYGSYTPWGIELFFCVRDPDTGTALPLLFDKSGAVPPVYFIESVP